MTKKYLKKKKTLKNLRTKIKKILVFTVNCYTEIPITFNIKIDCKISKMRNKYFIL